MPARQLDFFAALGLIALCSATIWAQDGPPFVPEKVAAVATDESVTPTPAEVAREVLRLQEELGGSVASGFGAPHEVVSVPPQQPPQPWRPMPKSPVLALRETAWQLDQSAHVLESLDLYDQADALRETADKLRKDARGMKAEKTTHAG
jgi:hypothetical protein